MTKKKNSQDAERSSEKRKKKNLADDITLNLVQVNYMSTEHLSTLCTAV